MTYLKYLFVFIGLQMASSQVNDDLLFVVDYVGTYQRYKTQDTPYKEYFRLMKRQDSSIFQSINGMIKDTVLRDVTSTKTFRKLPNTHHSYAIRYERDTLIYWDKVFQKDYEYEEKPNFEWSFLSQTKIISGYNCRLASVNYSGRTWFAWYAIELPINAGPYKFRGLPGLIIDCYDKDMNYRWQFFKLYKSEKKIVFQKFHFSNELEEIIKITKNDFLELQYSLKNASFNELNKTGASGFKVLSMSDDSSLRETKTLNGRGFIPIELKE